MAMGKRRRRARQPSMWVASTDLPRSAGHPFYQRLNRVLDDAGFDTFVEEQCATFYADGVGRPAYGAVNSTRSAVSTRRGCRRCIAIPSQ